MNEVLDTRKLWSQEAEEATLASVLISPDMLGVVQGFLRPGDFYLVRHRVIWQALERLESRGDPIELATVCMELQASGQLDDVGGYAYIMHLVGDIQINSMHAETYGRLVCLTAQRRAMVEAGDELRKMGFDESAKTDVVIAKAEQAILNLRRRQMSVDAPTLSMTDATQAKLQAMFDSEKRYEQNPNYVIGVRTGVTDLDLMLDGLRPGAITTLAGSTASGKTAMCLQMIRFAARFGVLHGLSARPAKTLLFSGEMTLDQMMNRILSAMTGVPVRDIERGSYSKVSTQRGVPSQKDLLIDAMGELDGNHALSFESGKRMNTAQIRQRVRTLVCDNALDLLALDGLLQIEAMRVDPSDSRKQQAFMNDKRRDFIEMIMNDLEDIALTYNTPILLTHQLSRASAGRQNKRPILSDLAEANFVEQKSAVILFLYRKGHHEPDLMTPNLTQIICEKNRFGITGDINQMFNPQFTRFEDTEHITLGGE